MISVQRIKEIFHSKITTNIIWLLLERGVQIIIGFIITGLLARSLGTQGYGMYQYASAIIVVVMSLTYVCGSEVLVPIITKSEPNKVFLILFNSFIVRLVSSVTVFIGLIIYLSISNYSFDLKFLIGLWGLVLIINEPFAVIRTWMESNTYIKPNVVIRIISLFVKFILIYLFYYLNLEIYWIGLFFFIEALTIASGQTIYFKSSFKYPIIFSIDRKLILSLMKFGGAFWFSVVFMFLFTKIDKIVLKEFISFSDLGLYTSAMSFTDQLNAIAPIISISFAPLYIYSEKSVSQTIHNTFRIVGLLLIISIFLAITIAFFSQDIVSFILGDLFAQSSEILRHSVWICVIVFADSGLNLILYKNKVYKLLFFKWFIAFTINFIIVFLCVSKLGVYAGVLGIYLGYLFSVLISLYYILTLKRNISKG